MSPDNHVQLHDTRVADRSIAHLLHRASQMATEMFAAMAGPKGLTPRQFTVLKAVSEREGLSQTDLVAETGIDRSTLADIVRRMLKKGLLVRHRTKEDQRTYAVRLSLSGREILEAHEPLAQSADEQLLAAVPSDLHEGFVEALGHLTSGWDGADEKVGNGSRHNTSHGEVSPKEKQTIRKMTAYSAA